MTYTIYECENEMCPLGTPGTPGRFSGGATKEQITTLTGNPEPEHHGEGVCPNCGTPSKVVIEGEPKPHKGTDPLQEVHDKIGGKAEREALAVRDRVMSPDDKLTAEEGREAVAEISAQAQRKINDAAENKEADNA